MPSAIQPGHAKEQIHDKVDMVYNKNYAVSESHLMRCPACGAELHGKELCSRCGAKIEEKIEIEYKDFKISELLEIRHKKYKPDGNKSTREPFPERSSSSGRAEKSSVSEKNRTKQASAYRKDRSRRSVLHERDRSKKVVAAFLLLAAFVVVALAVWRFIF